MFCPNCGKQLSEESAFCGYCGCDIVSCVQTQSQKHSLDQSQSQYQSQNNINQNARTGNNGFVQNNFVQAQPKPKYVLAPANFKSSKFNPLFIVFAVVCSVTIILYILHWKYPSAFGFPLLSSILYYIDFALNSVTWFHVSVDYICILLFNPEYYEAIHYDVPVQTVNILLNIFMVVVSLICIQKNLYIKKLSFAKVAFIIFSCICALNILCYWIYYIVYALTDTYAYGIDWIIRDVIKWIGQAGFIALYILTLRAVIKLDKAYKFSLANIQR